MFGKQTRANNRYGAGSLLISGAFFSIADSLLTPSQRTFPGQCRRNNCGEIGGDSGAVHRRKENRCSPSMPIHRRPGAYRGVLALRAPHLIATNLFHSVQRQRTQACAGESCSRSPIASPTSARPRDAGLMTSVGSSRDGGQLLNLSPQSESGETAEWRLARPANQMRRGRFQDFVGQPFIGGYAGEDDRSDHLG